MYGIYLPTCTLYLAAFHVGKYDTNNQDTALITVSICLPQDWYEWDSSFLRSKGMRHKNQDPHVRSLVLKEIYGYDFITLENNVYIYIFIYFNIYTVYESYNVYLTVMGASQ